MDINASLVALDDLVGVISAKLRPCPICGNAARLEEGMQDYGVTCLEDCPSPMCDHHDPRYVAFAWNTWVRWYSQAR